MTPPPPPPRAMFDSRLNSIQSPSLLSPYGFTSGFMIDQAGYPRPSTDTVTLQSPDLRRPSSPSLPLLPVSNPYSGNEAGPSRLRSTPRRAISHPGCVLCGLVASAASVNDALTAGSRPVSPLPSPRVDSFLLQQSRPPLPGPYPQPGSQSSIRTGTTILGGREIHYADDDITVYPARGKERLCSEGKHIIVVVNRHCETVYDFGPADVPMLSHILSTAEQLLSPMSTGDAESGRGSEMRVGFVGSVMKDPQSPHKHLHAHAMIGPVDTSLPGATLWRRNVVFGSLNWWSVDDLRAEIRESSSNNRVKSGYSDRGKAPIDRVPDAGSLAGLPNALDPQNDAPSEGTSRPITPRDDPIGIVTPSLAPEGHEGHMPPSIAANAAKGKRKEGPERVAKA